MPNDAGPTLDYRTPVRRPKPEPSVLAWLSLASTGGLVLFCIVAFSTGTEAALLVAVVLALTALVSGIGGLLATRRRNRGGRRAATLGTVVGGVVVAAMFVLPTLGRAREPASRIKCASNMRQIGLALSFYLAGHHGLYPPDLASLMADPDCDLTNQVLVCPSSTDEPAAEGAPPVPGKSMSFIYLAAGPASKTSAATVLLYEPMTNHNGEGANFLYGDGTVRFSPRRQARAMIAQLEAGTNPPDPNAAPPAE